MLVLKYGVDVKISIKILVFTLDYFQEKLTTKFFKKSKKTLFCGLCGYFGLFNQIWAKMNFSGKKLCQFLNIPIIYHRAINQRKPKYAIPEENSELTNGWTEKQKDRQTSMIL